MNLEVIGRTKDLRSHTHVIYAQIDITDYLTLVGDDFSEFKIQRKREKHQAYVRLKEDIVQGTVLPTITLVLKRNIAAQLAQNIDLLSNKELSNRLNKANQVHILDGLQRTYLIQDLIKKDTILKKGQKLLLEFWVEERIENIIYRFIVLNAGRKEMSLDHQLELLFLTIHERIEEEIMDLKIYTKKENGRRKKAGDFSFSNIVTSYYCFLTKTYLVNKRQLVGKQILEKKVIYSSVTELNEQFSKFIEYLKIYLELDKLTYNKYPANKNWLAQETVMNAFFGALARFGNSNDKKQNRIINALNLLLRKLKTSDEEDIWGVDTFNRILNSADSGKFNVGAITRKLLFNGFREFFITEGEDNFKTIWEQEGVVLFEKQTA